MGKRFWILTHIGGKRFLGIGGALADSDDSGGVVTFKNSAVFSEGERARGVFCRLPIRIVGTAFDVINHLAVEFEGNPQLDERFHLALSGQDAIAGRSDRVQMAGADGRESRPRRSVNVDNAAASEVALERTRGLFLNLSPRGIGNRSQLTMQIIHKQSSPFREPMPSEPSLDGALGAEVSTGAEAIAGWSGETLSRNVAVGMKNRFPVTAMLKSRMRS